MARVAYRGLTRVMICSYQGDDLLSPRGAGLDVRAHENVVIPSLEILDQVVGRLFLLRFVQAIDDRSQHERRFFKLRYGRRRIFFF